MQLVGGDGCTGKRDSQACEESGNQAVERRAARKKGEIEEVDEGRRNMRETALYLISSQPEDGMCALNIMARLNSTTCRKALQPGCMWKGQNDEL